MDLRPEVYPGDDVANGIVAAFKEYQPTVPVVVRLTGTNEKEAQKIMTAVKLPTADTLDDAVQKAISLAGVE